MDDPCGTPLLTLKLCDNPSGKIICEVIFWTKLFDNIDHAGFYTFKEELVSKERVIDRIKGFFLVKGEKGKGDIFRVGLI